MSFFLSFRFLSPLSLCDHGSHTLVREYFLQQRVGLPSVDDVRGLHPLRDASDAAFHLGNHPAGDDVLVDQVPRGVDVELPVKRAHVVLVPEHPRDVRHQDELLGAKRRRNLPRSNVRVHVERLAALVRGHARDHGNGTLLHDRLDEGRVDPGDVPDVPQLLLARLPGLDDVGVLPAQAHGLAAGEVDERHDGLVHLARQDGLHDLHRVLVRHAQAVMEPGLQPNLVQPPVYLRPPAVKQHDAYAHARQEHHVAEHLLLQSGVRHGGPPVLDHNRFR
mmetsp:Transcript_13489/g.25788  ORF Transcript_13489/g.25788 Transcript_13489/m.25788 type:complete len:277 (-) Transcript_13489:677-1507(-)